jgi:hypothetical protein
MTKKFVAIIVLGMMCATVSTAQTENPVKGEQKSAVLKIHRTNKQVTMVSKTAEGKQDTTVATKTRVCDVSDEVKLARYEAKRRGEKPEGAYFNNKNKDITGRKLSRPFLEVGGGVTYAFSSKEVRPVFRGTFGWEMRYALLFADLEMSLKGFSTSNDLSEHGLREGAEASGRYNTFTGVLNGAVKLWNSSDFNSFIALFGGAGYSYAKTDGDDESIRFSSSFYQFRWQGGILAKWGFAEHWGLTGRLYVQNPSNNEHDSDQDAGKLAVGAQLGVNYSF